MSPFMIEASRRALLAGLGAVALAAAIGIRSLSGMAAKEESPAEVPVDELMKPSALPDIALGSPDAKVTVIEYASLTCGHCANFQNNQFPKLKEKYIDTGKVRFIVREFPLNSLAAAAAMVARCVPPENAHPFIEKLFATQEAWAFGEGDAAPKLFDVAKDYGLSKDEFDKCLANKPLLEKIASVRDRADKVFGVNATPTFFINGKKLAAAPVIEEFDKVVEPLLAK